MVRLFLSCLLLLGITFCVYAQQEPQFTQFMHYKMGINPAYAGTEDSPILTGLVRNQWLGLDGAPQTQLIAYEMPVFNKRVGFGASLRRRSIGLLESYTAEANYVYRINFGRGKLGLGLQSSVRSLSFNFEAAEGTQPIESDPTIPTGARTKYVPNVGAGLYYHSTRFFMGISIPRFLKNEIDIADNNQEISQEIQHLYIIIGGLIDLGDDLGFKPQVLIKTLESAPFDADLNLSLIYDDRYTAGLSYRLGGSMQNGFGESVSLLLSTVINEQVELGISYDYSLSQIRNYTNGSIEAMIKYYIGGRSDRGRVVSPLPGSDYYK